VGFAVMSGIDAPDRSDAGQLFTRQGISLSLLQPLHLRLRIAHAIPRVAASVGPSHPLDWSAREGRRMASEDSRRIGSVWSFLLVFRTSHVVTCLTQVVEDPPGLPAYSRLRTAPSPVRGAAPSACLRASYLRTVIVTAAVYRRLGSELRHPKVADPSP
jgi:hypothetical protein